jgi:polyhydroxyalkanoate synthesis regulator protein
MNIMNILTIKKYANRKLYNPQITKYVTLDELVSYLKNGQAIQVIDNDSGMDVTNETLKACVVKLNLDNELLNQLIMAG